LTEGRFIDLLPELQAVAARHAGPLSYDHPGQLAWGSVTEGEAPAVIAGRDGFGILESPHWLQVGGSPGRVAEVIEWARSRASGFNVMALDGPLASRLAQAGGRVVARKPWFVQQVISLAAVTVPEIEGYELRPVDRGEAAARAACHRAAWSGTVPSGMTTGMYERLMETPYYDTALDWVAVTCGPGEMVASCTAWRCGDIALVEPVGCAPAHRRRGLGGGVTRAALAAAREQGATTGIVRPRGDQGYPVPVRLYRAIGFTDQARTREYRFPGPGGPAVR
jgi:predicted N-acetyltransferase YhbS